MSIACDYYFIINLVLSYKSDELIFSRFTIECPIFSDKDFGDQSNVFAPDVFHPVHVSVNELRVVQHLQSVVLVELEQMLVIQNLQVFVWMKRLLRNPSLFPGSAVAHFQKK